VRIIQGGEFHYDHGGLELDVCECDIKEDLTPKKRTTRSKNSLFMAEANGIVEILFCHSVHV
jgi:hypothetical protein